VHVLLHDGLATAVVRELGGVVQHLVHKGMQLFAGRIVRALVQTGDSATVRETTDGGVFDVARGSGRRRVGFFAEVHESTVTFEIKLHRVIGWHFLLWMMMMARAFIVTAITVMPTICTGIQKNIWQPECTKL